MTEVIEFANGDRLAKALATIERTEGDLSVPAIADKRCIASSKLLRRELGGGELICAYGARDVTGPSTAPGHVALLYRGLVYDITARQFWPDTEYPLVEPLEAWAARFSGYGAPGRHSGLVQTYEMGRTLVPMPEEAR